MGRHLRSSSPCPLPTFSSRQHPVTPASSAWHQRHQDSGSWSTSNRNQSLGGASGLSAALWVSVPYASLSCCPSSWGQCSSGSPGHTGKALRRQRARTPRSMLDGLAGCRVQWETAPLSPANAAPVAFQPPRLLPASPGQPDPSSLGMPFLQWKAGRSCLWPGGLRPHKAVPLSPTAQISVATRKAGAHASVPGPSCCLFSLGLLWQSGVPWCTLGSLLKPVLGFGQTP